jgi:hypothetical protein
VPEAERNVNRSHVGKSRAINLSMYLPSREYTLF